MVLMPVFSRFSHLGGNPIVQVSFVAKILYFEVPCKSFCKKMLMCRQIRVTYFAEIEKVVILFAKPLH